MVADLHQPEILNRIEAAESDLILSLQWRRILRPVAIKLARYGVANLHNALLPLLRGCGPFSWAIHDGLECMGVTLHQVVD
jgi:methionyl-tRNA formyltransferase